MEGEDGKSKDCALVTSTFKDPRDEKEQGKETRMQEDRECAVLELGDGFQGDVNGPACHMLLMNKIRTKD